MVQQLNLHRLENFKAGLGIELLCIRLQKLALGFATALVMSFIVMIAATDLIRIEANTVNRMRNTLPTRMLAVQNARRSECKIDRQQ